MNSRRQSPRRIEANRRNAQHSTGPRTPQGKANARLNRLTHGLTCRLDLLGDGDRDVIDAFSAPIAAAMNPETAEQLRVARGIADEHWRLQRACAVEAAWLAEGDGAEGLLRVSLYEQRIRRTMTKKLWKLRFLQIEEKANNGFGHSN